MPADQNTQAKQRLRHRCANTSGAVIESSEDIMNDQNSVVKPGIHLSIGTLGLAVTQWSGYENNSPDFNDCVPAIEPCGEDVFELWFHLDGKQSVCVLGNADVFKKLGRALMSLIDPSDICGDGQDE